MWDFPKTLWTIQIYFELLNHNVFRYAICAGDFLTSLNAQEPSEVNSTGTLHCYIIPMVRFTPH